MTKKEKENNLKAFYNLKNLEKFLTIERNEAHGNKERQAVFNEILKILQDTKILIYPKK